MDNLEVKLNLWLWRLTSALVIIGFGVLAIYWKRLPPQVPLLYTRAWGDQQLVSPFFLWLIPVISGLLGLGASLGVAKITSDRILQVMLITTCLIAEIILSLGLVRIIFLVS